TSSSTEAMSSGNHPACRIWIPGPVISQSPETSRQESLVISLLLLTIAGQLSIIGCCCGQAFGIAEQHVGRAYLDEQRREPGQGGEQRRRQRRLRVSPGHVVGGELAEHGGGGDRILLGA